MTKLPVEKLPEFKNPPLSEVVLSIQFASLTALKGVHLGLFWNRFRRQYPNVSEQAPIQTRFETFGANQTAQPALQWQALLVPPLPRYWFEKSGEPDLLQIQHDRLVHNWRKGDGETPYPRYGKIKAKFEKELASFIEWIEAEDLGRIIPNQCEIIYTNLIDLPASEALHADLSRVTPLWTDSITEEMSADLEDITTNSRFIFSDGGKPAGRLYVQFQPVFRQSDMRPMIKLEIIARGKPADDSISSALDFLDLEHAQIVKTFAAVTSKEMHKLWGRKNANARI